MKLTSTVNKLFDPTHQMQIPIGIKVTDITSVEPPKLETCLVGIRIVLVTLCHIWTSYTNLSLAIWLLDLPFLIKDRHFLTHWFPNRTRLVWTFLR